LFHVERHGLYQVPAEGGFTSNWEKLKLIRVIMKIIFQRGFELQPKKLYIVRCTPLQQQMIPYILVISTGQTAQNIGVLYYVNSKTQRTELQEGGTINISIYIGIYRYISIYSWIFGTTNSSSVIF